MPAISGQMLYKLLIIIAVLLGLPVYAGSVDLAHARVMADHAALLSAEDDYRRSRARGYLSPREMADYETYVAQLRRRFMSACAELAQVAADLPGLPTPCPSQLPRITGAAAIDQTRELTRGERTTALARDLDAALGEFDEMLLREQERVKAATPPPADSRSGQGALGATAAADGSAESAAEGAGEVAGEGLGEDPDVASADGASPTGPTGAAGGGRHKAARDVPPDIPDGSDDDVAARQLREAAEKERDPELRARLWDEYRRYKRGTP